MKVLSLFDGISCGRLAFERAGVPVEVYYASEIEQTAMRISNKNFPDIVQLGDVTRWREWDLDWSDIDMVIGGSPCQGFSAAGKKLNFDDPRSKLFFVFEEVLNHAKKCNPNVLFLLENVRMRKDHMDIITERLGVLPVALNSRIVTAQNRDRLYWTNVSGINEVEFEKLDKKLTLRDVFDPSQEHREIHIKHPETMVKKKNYIQYDQNLRGNDSQDQRLYYMDGKSGTLLLSYSSIPKIEYEGRYWLFTPEECERLQTVPVGYTQADGVSKSKRYEALGNGWTVDVIAWIFSHIPREETTSESD